MCQGEWESGACLYEPPSVLPHSQPAFPSFAKQLHVAWGAVGDAKGKRTTVAVDILAPHPTRPLPPPAHLPALTRVCAALG